MRHIIMIAILVFTAAGLAACVSTGGNGNKLPKLQEVSTASLPAEASTTAEGESPLSRAVLNAVNTFRAGKGVAALAPDGHLQRAAAVQAADMALRDFFGHYNPDGQGPRERVLAVNPDFTGSVAENIQMVDGQSYAAMSDAALARTMAEKWAQSPMHRKNMQSPDLTRSGVGIARDGNRIIAVQVFSGP
ncbi:MAG: hypothetical protein CVT73_02600 [Alphaproteobacteria bacterium HGW-Alphaproteobacteria-12]|nr:MAG: hypothetical protein CVT73_02600 [Alphaproteobacteria bacterium HGW-Alphaproteobacteria-12]